MRENKNIIALDKVSLELISPDGGKLQVINNVSAQIVQGETVSIVGPSGSGKTTLLMLISGVEKPTSGNITVAGVNIVGLDEDGLAEFRKNHVGVVFQNFHLIPTMTAKENVSIALQIAGINNSDQKAEEALKSVGLEHRMSHYPSQLSGGEQQRVALARAFATEPSILLADEPTGNLDSDNGKKVIDLLFDLKEKSGTTLILITHDMNIAKSADRILKIKDGQIIK
jgi:putative ABC transport system ATP-binding protein